MDIQSFIPADMVVQFNRYRNYIVAAVTIFGGGIAFATYQYFESVKREETSQIALAETLQEFQRAQQMPELWSDVEIAAKTAYRQYKNAQLAPQFLSLQVAALIASDKLQEAIDLMQQAVIAMSTKSPVYYLNAIKLARMKIDSPDTAIKQQGITELQTLAQDKKNLQRDQALYYLGMHYKNSNELDNTHKVWQELIDNFVDDKISSPWAQLVQKEIEELR